MREKIQKIADIVTIAFPAIVALLGVLGMAGIVETSRKFGYVIFIILGIMSLAASLVYNYTSKKT